MEYITRDEYFSTEWFKVNKPAVITIGNRFGQINIVKQLAKMMGSLNITIPILVEGIYEGVKSMYVIG